MNELSGWWAGQRSGRWASGLAQDAGQAMRVPVEWRAFTFVGATILALCIVAEFTPLGLATC